MTGPQGLTRSEAEIPHPAGSPTTNPQNSETTPGAHGLLESIKSQPWNSKGWELVLFA